MTAPITAVLNRTVQVQLDANGNGTARIGPASAREYWYEMNAHVQVSSDNNEAVCNIYVGDAAQQRNFRDATASGSLGDSTDRISNDRITVGSYVWAVWTGGDPKAYATLSISGSIDLT